MVGHQLIMVLLITPVWKDELSFNEINRLKISIQNNKDSLHLFIGPKSGSFTFLRRLFPNSNFVGFDDQYFTSVQSYSELLLEREFYAHFEEYEYILICQLDAILIGNISNLPSSDFDYIGSPWEFGYKVAQYRKKLIIDSRLNAFLPSKTINVGNGGLSLRNVTSMAAISEEIHRFNPFLKYRHPEDVLLSYFAIKLGFKLPNFSEANEIFREKTATDKLRIPNVLGFHALDKYNPNLEQLIFNKFLPEITIEESNN